MATYSDLHNTLVELGTVSTLVALGVHSGEMSQRQAIKTYGKWIERHIKAQDIRPVRVEDGHAGTRYYLIADILRLKERDLKKAQLI